MSDLFKDCRSARDYILAALAEAANPRHFGATIDDLADALETELNEQFDLAHRECDETCR